MIEALRYKTNARKYSCSACNEHFSPKDAFFLREMNMSAKNTFLSVYFTDIPLDCKQLRIQFQLRAYM